MRRPVALYIRLREESANFEEYLHRLFWLNVDKSEPDNCWKWVGNCGKGGYGKLGVRRRKKGRQRSLLAHKLSWWVHTGKYPRLPLCVCHHCDNPGCVNPAHLFIGTNQDNIDDRDRKGRQVRGSRQWASKLTRSAVEQIRKLNQNGWRQKQIAQRFKVTEVVIWSVLHGNTWRHVPMPSVFVNYNPRKLTAQKAAEIREEYALGLLTQRELGKKYSVNGGTISKVINYQRWKDA